MNHLMKDATSTSDPSGSPAPVANIQSEPMLASPYASIKEPSVMETSDSVAITSNAESMDVNSPFLPGAVIAPEHMEVTSQKAAFSDVAMQSSSSDELSASKLTESMEAFADNSKTSLTDTESVSVKSEPISEVVAKSLQRQTMTPPLYSPTRSLTPMSEKIEMVSPVELIETSDGSVRIKGELDAPHLSASSTPCRSRSSSQSSKSSRGSPKSRRSPSSKAKKKRPPPMKDGEHSDKNDFYCWICHKEGEVLCCELCPRVVHGKCLNLVEEPEGDWYCPECEKIMVAECKETQSRAMSQLTIDQLALHLRYALQRMKTSGCEPFLEPVNTKEFTDYLDYVFHPMDISTLEKNIKKKTYGSTEAFLADVKWIVHNCVIYNGPNTKLTQVAKVIVKIAQHEMSEIEVCPECYLNACRKRDNWFCEPCRDLHVLVWAKLQGFPHWPAKALRIEKGLVDVRFFGQHDRAWVPLANCYLMSKEMPLPVKNKKKGRGPGAKGGLDSAMQEAQGYIDNVVKRTGSFEHAPPRTPLTHLDLCRKPITGQSLPRAGVEKLTEAVHEDNAPASVNIKKEAIEEEKMKTDSDSSKSSAGNRILNLKIGPAASDINLTPASAPTKKKSKVVTTSGAHPEKGYRPYDPKKKASHVLLEKTIASLRGNIEDKGDETSSDSDSSLEEENETSSQNSSSSPDKGKKSDGANVEEKKSKVEDGSDTNLVIDVHEDTNAGKKKDSAVSALLEKGGAKLKKQSAGDGEVKPFKTRSILLNKDPDRKPASPASTPLSGSVKRKHNEDASSSSKIRKVDSANVNKPTANHQKTSTKINPVKDRKHSLDNDKQKKSSEFVSKTKKEGLSPHAGSNQKKPVSTDSSKKKIMLSNAAKSRAEEGEKADLKNTAKMLAKKIARKQGALPEKSKASNSVPTKPPVVPSIDFAAKKLSSFTIPKHKPSPSRNESHTDTNSTNTSSKFSNHTSQNVTHPTRFPTVNVPLQKLKKYNEKITQNVQNIIVEMYEDMLAMFKNTQGSTNSSSNSISGDTSVANHQQVTKMQLEIEQLKWSHQQQLAELQHNHDLTIAEIRQSLENEKIHMLEAAKRKSEAEKAKAVADTKKKQWCANCWKEAVLYCCWNTTYCDYPCQQLHWPKHQANCSHAEGKGPSSATLVTPETPTKLEAPPVKDISPVKVPVSSSVPYATEKVKKKMAEKVERVPQKVDEDIPVNDDEHSDTDMMVIDETDKPDLLSPASPDDLKGSKVTHVDAKTSDDVEKTRTSLDDVITAKTSSTASPPITSQSETSKPRSALHSSDVEKSVASSTSASANLAGVIISALTSDKVKPLPTKSSTLVITSAAAAPTSTAAVVPSKLIDDIFSKVHQEDAITSLSSVTPSTQAKQDQKTEAQLSFGSTLKPSVSDVTGPNESEPVKTSSQKSSIPSDSSALGAVSDRLMKIKSVDNDDGTAASAEPQQRSASSVSTSDAVDSTSLVSSGMKKPEHLSPSAEESVAEEVTETSADQQAQSELDISSPSKENAASDPIDEDGDIIMDKLNVEEDKPDLTQDAETDDVLALVSPDSPVPEEMDVKEDDALEDTTFSENFRSVDGSTSDDLVTSVNLPTTESQVSTSVTGVSPTFAVTQSTTKVSEDVDMAGEEVEDQVKNGASEMDTDIFGSDTNI